MNFILAQQKTSLPKDVKTNSKVVSGLATGQVLTRKNGFWWAHMRAWNYRQHSGLVGVCLTILYTTMCPVEFNGSQTVSSGEHGGASHHKDRRPTQQICDN